MSPNRARQVADWYLGRGFSPVPTRPDEKQPLVHISQFWNEYIPEELWPRKRVHNLQVMTGSKWLLLGLDVDGESGAKAWERIASVRECPETWKVVNGGPGFHLWFRVPVGTARIPTRCIWEGDGSHQNIEILGDKKLIVAPPSAFRNQLKIYRWDDGLSPRDMPEPAVAPDWLIHAPSIRGEPCPTAKAKLYVPPRRQESRFAWAKHDVLDALQGRFVEVGKALGLRITSDVSCGWADCRVPGREDRRASGRLSNETGSLWDFKEGRRVSFFDAIQAENPSDFRTWVEALEYVGENFCRHLKNESRNNRDSVLSLSPGRLL